jgi:adenine-specific DNA-methyltransferase
LGKVEKNIIKNTHQIADEQIRNSFPDIIGEQKSELGQYMTPSVVAQFMADFFTNLHSIEKIKILDPGAGIGSLSSALVESILFKHNNIKDIDLVAFEIDIKLYELLEDVYDKLEESCRDLNINFQKRINNSDFIEKISYLLSNELFENEDILSFSHIIMNPPYKKINSNSKHRKLLRKVGIETSNFYTAFLSLAFRLLEPEGELVAITPRSFCNGSYFLPFRNDFDSKMSIKRIHVFHSRSSAFKDDEVLQENIIFLAKKDKVKGKIKITTSTGIDFSDFTEREVDYSKVINTNDPNKIIHIATDDLDEHVIERVNAFNCTHKDLGVTISTGPVVDFRMKKFLRKNPEKNTIPLLYSSHMNSGLIEWPKEGFKKYNSIIDNESTKRWFMPTGFYTIVKRFSAKEEKRRIVSAVVTPTSFKYEKIGFENHLNVFHTEKNGLEELLAKGLSVWLNSSIVDMYFRQFNGNTQVNASDLEILPYPDYEFLIELGSEFKNNKNLSQKHIDELIEEKLISEKNIKSINPLSVIKIVQKMSEILKEYNHQKNVLDALAVLIIISLLNLRPGHISWNELIGSKKSAHEIKDFIKEYYGKQYAITSIKNLLSSIYGANLLNIKEGQISLKTELIDHIRSFLSGRLSYEQVMAKH